MCECQTCKHVQSCTLERLEITYRGAQYVVERAEAILYCAANYPFMREQYLANV